MRALVLASLQRGFNPALAKDLIAAHDKLLGEFRKGDAEAALNIFVRFQEDTRLPKTYGAFLQEQRRLARAFENERVRWRT